MANKKISELPYINGGKISGNTLVPLVTYFSASTGDTVHTYVSDLQTYLTSGLTGNTVVGNFLPLSGGTVSGGTKFTAGLTANTISATTYQNLPPATFSGGTVTGPTIFTNGLTANTISATTYQNLPTDIRVTGGTYSAGTTTFTNNTGGTFNVTGFFTGGTDVRVTGGTYSAGTITFTNNTGGTFNVTGLTTGSTSTVSGNFLPLSGGTVTGQTFFTSGLTITGSTIIKDSTGITDAIDTSTRVLSDENGFGSVVFGSQRTLENLFGSSLDWGNKYLYKNDGSISFDWENGILTGQTNVESSTIYATTYLNLPTDIRITGSTYSNNTFTYTNNTGGTFNVLFNTVTGLTVNGNLTVTGNTNVRAFTGTSGTISGSGQNILTVIGSGNSTTSPIFTVQGSSGELFSINDSLVGSLFSVNDISGLPILEVFSDNTTLWGSYQAPSLNTTTKVTLTAGTNTIYSIPTSAYTGAFIDYTLISTGTTGARAGQIMSIWSGTSANFTETQTTSIGTTTGVTFTVAVSGNNAVLSSSATTTGWTLKTIVRGI